MNTLSILGAVSIFVLPWFIPDLKKKPTPEFWARIATGGAVRFDDRTIERVKEAHR